MDNHSIIYCLTLTIFFFSGARSAVIKFRNNCSFTVWPATLTGGGKPQLSTTGFELASKASSTLEVPVLWSGRFWARTNCTSDATGKFTCGTADCASGEVACNGSGAIPPASLIELFVADNKGNDFYDVTLVDGFNLPISVTPKGGSGNCSSTSCRKNVNAVCPPELAVRGSDGSVVACKSACVAFNDPKYCCTGAFGSPDECHPTKYSRIFKRQCPQA